MTAAYILGVDYGEKRVGVAIAHTIARLPRPLTTVPNTESLIQDLQQLVESEQAGLVVVGLPRNMNGDYTPQTELAEAFANHLSSALSVPVELADETLTSVDAEARLGPQYAKGSVDAVAATIILERYLADHPVNEGVA